MISPQRYMGWLLCMVMMISCSRSKNVPSDIIQKEEMGQILFDIGLAESSIESVYYNNITSNRDSMLRAQLDKVLAVHQISQADFLKSYQFYKMHPAILKEVVDSLQARAQRTQQNIYQGNPKRKKPSIDRRITQPPS